VRGFKTLRTVYATIKNFGGMGALLVESAFNL